MGWDDDGDGDDDDSKSHVVFDLFFATNLMALLV